MKKIILILSIIFSNLSYADELSVDTFFNKFNMRSTLSSMGPQLKFWCGSYPSEFFKIKEKTNDRLILVRNEDHFWDITILDNNKVAISNYITSGTYNSKDVTQLIYINEKSEWWDELSVNKGQLTNPEQSDCKKQKVQKTETDKFKDGKYIGEEPYKDKYGHTYVGEWKDGKYHGQGTFTWKNGSKYVGEFRNGEFHGQGTRTWATGEVDKGIFEDGVLVERN